MIKGRIEFEGKTMEDVREAIEEALTRINLGNITGFDHNEDGSFNFDVEHDAQRS